MKRERPFQRGRHTQLRLWGLRVPSVIFDSTIRPIINGQMNKSTDLDLKEPTDYSVPWTVRVPVRRGVDVGDPPTGAVRDGPASQAPVGVDWTRPNLSQNE